MMRKIMATAIFAFLFSSTMASKVESANIETYYKASDTIDAAQQLIFKERLSAIQKIVPLDYNEFVHNYITILSSKGKEKIARALGLSKYYFPIYEKIFRETGIPEEIKFLSVVESSLNPQAVSRVGATGLWQFMYTTGKVYGLTIDAWEDERKNPVAASYAAAAYLRDAYKEFDDWLLAIASYNCGKGGVLRAIAKAGGQYNFWAIRPFLPKETQNYVPAFIATAYAMNYSKLHNINPKDANFTIQTEMVQLNSQISLESIAKATNIDIEELSILNPSYLKKIINASPTAPKSLVIPVLDKSVYEALYAVINTGGKAVFASQNITPAPKNNPLYYKVKLGDKLLDIATKHNIEVQDIKVWNNIKRGLIVPGQVLRVSETEATLLKASKYFTYRVQPGDTLLKIATKFVGTTVSGLKVVNGLAGKEVKPGTLLKIVKG